MDVRVVDKEEQKHTSAILKSA
eukprot:COSAG02_NODE_3248_length_7097_cov_2.679194_1_plen_21_part_10